MITLGIIGIVAAMTLPALISKHEKLTTATKLKKSYSTLGQADKMSELKMEVLTTGIILFPDKSFGRNI